MDTLNTDLSAQLQKNGMFRKYKDISDYFANSNVGAWWDPEKGKGDCGQAMFAAAQREKRHWLESQIKVAQNSLEIGPGRGRFTWHFLQTSGHHTAVELNKTFADALQKHYPYITIINADATVITFEPAEFDLIHCIDVLVHIPDIPSLIRKFALWLQPGGTLITDITLASWYAHYKKRGVIHRGIDQQAFENLMLGMGFKTQATLAQGDEQGVPQFMTYIWEKC